MAKAGERCHQGDGGGYLILARRREIEDGYAAVGLSYLTGVITTSSMRNEADVGANQPALDQHDFRIIGETLAGTAAAKGSKTGLPGLPDSQADVGGWEEMPTVSRLADWDRDRDGLPDWWERISGSRPDSAAGDFSDGNRDRLGEGITELEHYLNWMAAPHAEVAAGGNVTLALAPLTRGFTAKPKFKVVATVGGNAVPTADGQSLVFTPKDGFTGIGSVTFRVSDADGDQMTRTIGIWVF